LKLRGFQGYEKTEVRRAIEMIEIWAEAGERRPAIEAAEEECNVSGTGH
jgi:hypothetical protein